MKKLILFVFGTILFFIISHDSAGQMRALSYDTLDENNHLHKISLLPNSSSEGYMAFSKFLGYTTDSGRHFIRKYITNSNVDFSGYPVNLTFGFGINGVIAFHKDTLLAYGDYGLVPSILYSTNGGNTFKLIFHSQFNAFALRTGITDMVFPGNGNTGYAVDCDRILKSNDRGKSWFSVKIDPDRFFDRINAPDVNNVFAYSLDPVSHKLWKTTNAGNSWSEVIRPPQERLSSVFFFDAQKGYIRQENNDQQNAVYFTSNGGSSWRLMNEPKASSAPDGYDLLWVNDSTAFALGGLYYTFKTTDSGKVWEVLPRDNDFLYAGHPHNTLYAVGEQRIWAGGDHGFLELTTNGGGTPLPAAYFYIDTLGSHQTDVVQLRNYSKPHYSFKWFLNDTLISTNYNTSYVHHPFRLHDTVKLVVNNGIRTDTLIQYQSFYPKVFVYGFTPDSAATGNIVVITGLNFSEVQSVRFGGVPALSFTVQSPTEIHARVDQGASGEVRVTTTFGTGAKSGFRYIPVPAIDLPTSLADSFLCRSERLYFTIQQSETNVRYELLDAENTIRGSVVGTGGTVQLISDSIAATGNFRIKASRLNTTATALFTGQYLIRVEKTRSLLQANRINLPVTEAVQFTALSTDAQFFKWTFYQDASISSSTTKRSLPVGYATSGIKTVQLISTSAQGCSDTLNSHAVFVYQPATPAATNYAFPLDSTGQVQGQIYHSMTASSDDGLLLIGQSAPNGKLRSRIGFSQPMGDHWSYYLSKYSADGVLQWMHRFNEPNTQSALTAVNTDAAGNIYLAGYTNSLKWFHFANGDSLRFWSIPSDTIPSWERTTGFLIKMDPQGNYLWHTLLYDHTVIFSGYPVIGAWINHIIIKDHHVLLQGDFNGKLSWIRNGSVTQLYNMNNSTFARDNQNKFILKIDADGGLKWKSYLHHESVNSYSLEPGTLTANGELMTSGSYEMGVTYFDADSASTMSLGGTVAYNKGYIMKIDSTGHLKWYNEVKTTVGFGSVGYMAGKTDAAGQLYLSGQFFTFGQKGRLELKHSDGTVQTTDSLAGFGLLKLNTGGKLIWGIGSRYPYYGGGYGIDLDSGYVQLLASIRNNDQTLGYFDLMSVDGSSRRVVTGPHELLLIRYDTTGQFKQLYNSGYEPQDGPINGYSMLRTQQSDLFIGLNKGMYIGGTTPQTLFNISVPPPFATGGDGLLLKMNPATLQVPVLANAGTDRSKCAGDTAQIGTVSSGLIYSWTSFPVGFTSNAPQPVVQPAVTTRYFLAVHNDRGVYAYDTVTITVMSLPDANAGIDKFTCPNQAVIIGTAAVSGLQYAWTANRQDNYTSDMAQPSVTYWGTALYYLKVTNANGCVDRDTVQVEVGNAEPVGAYADVNKNPVCQDSLVTFTGWDSWGGASPAFRWQVNGKDAYIGRFYRTDTLKNGDQVRVIITTSNVCSVDPVDTSNVVTMTINPTLPTAVQLNGLTTVEEGDIPFYWANFTNGGGAASFDWEDSTSTHGWREVTSARSPNLNYQPMATGDKLRVILNSSVSCAGPRRLVSNTLSFVVNKKVTAIDPDPAAAMGIRFYPNPVDQVLYLQGLKLSDQWRTLTLTNMNGIKVMRDHSLTGLTKLQVAVGQLAAGMYTGTLISQGGKVVYFRWIKGG